MNRLHRVAVAMGVVLGLGGCTPDGTSSPPVTGPTASSPEAAPAAPASTSGAFDPGSDPAADTTAATTAPSSVPPTDQPADPAPQAPAPQVTAVLVEEAPPTAAVCEAQGGFVTTASGRRVLLRADGLTGPAPTVFVLHGFTGSPNGVEQAVELTGLANERGIAVAYPEGSPQSLGGFAWNSGAETFAARSGDDIGALGEMVEAVVRSGCVDRDRITLSGLSNGAGMALAALCAPKLHGTFRSAVMVIPAIDDGVIAGCAEPGPAVPLSAVAAGQDRIAPLEGGNGLLAQERWFAEVARTVQGCRDVDVARRLTANVDRLVGTECATCTELLIVNDGSHAWPGTARQDGRRTPGTFDLNRRILDDVLADEPGCLAAR